MNCDYIWTTLHKKMIDHLTKLGIKNTVFAPVCKVEKNIVDISENEYVIKCFNKLDRYFFGIKQFKIMKSLEKCISVSEYDLIHAYYLFTDGNYARIISRKYNIPYVVAVRNTDVNVFFKHMIHLRCVGIKILKDARTVFFLSESYKRQVLYSYVPSKIRHEIEQKCVVLPNGIDNYWLDNKYLEKNYEETEKRIKNKNIRLIYAGRIDKNKNIELTVEAIRILEREGWSAHLTIVGPIEDQSIYERLRNEHSVTYIQKLVKEDLINRYRLADIFVMPSHTESFGLVYAEAMTQGLPVIYTRGQGFDQQFEKGMVGYAVSDEDPMELVEAIKNCASRYKHISSNALEVVGKFDWNNICLMYQKIYSNIINPLG